MSGTLGNTTVPAVTIRVADSGDAATLAGFNVAMARETEARDLDPGTVADGVAAALRDPALGFYLVAEIAGERVGALMVTREWSDWRDGAFWWVQSVYVLPAARGRGVYRRLYEEVHARAQSAGDVCGIRLYVERENVTAQHTYRRLGMEPTTYLVYEEMLSS